MSFFGSAFRATIFLQFNVQSHHLSPIQHSESLSSYCLVFKVTVPFTAWHSNSCLRFGIQSHRPTWHLVSPYSFSFSVYSYRAYSFRHLESSSFILLAFRVVSPQPCHSESWLWTFIFTDIAPLTFMALRSSWFFFSHLVALCLSPIRHRFSRFSFSLLMTQSFEFTTHTSVRLLGTLHLSFSRSSHRAVPFGRILSYTRR